MNKPKHKVGHKITTPDGFSGYVMKTEAYTAEAYLGHLNPGEYFGRKWLFRHTVACPTPEGDIRERTVIE